MFCQKTSKSFEIESLPFMHQNALISCSDYVFTNDWNSLNLSNHSPLVLIMYSYTFLEKSSTKYVAPPMDLFFMRPQTFKCTISKNIVVCLSALLPTLLHIGYPSCMLCNKYSGGMRGLPNFRPLTILRSAWTLFTFKWPSWRCQSSTGLLIAHERSHRSHLPQCIRMQEITPSIRST